VAYHKLARSAHKCQYDKDVPIAPSGLLRGELEMERRHQLQAQGLILKKFCIELLTF
jgi:hypothetical protein